jgi:RND family efflux transporter MFP subunit
MILRYWKSERGCSPPPSKLSKLGGAARTFCTLLALLIVTVSGCGGPSTAASSAVKANATAASETSAAVTVVHPARKTLTRATTEPGHVEAFELTPIYAKIEGYVLKTRTVTDKDDKPVVRELADMGDRVEEGEVLAEVAAPEMVEELKHKVAQAEQFKAAIDQAKAATTKAEGEYQRWKAEHERIAILAKGGSVSGKLVDEAEYQFRSAEAARQEAAARLSVANAQLKVAEADAARAGELLKYAKILAPFAGVITERNVDTGHFVRAPQGGTKPLFVVARTGKVRVFTNVREADAPLVNAGDPAVVRVPALDDAEITDKVRCTSWLLDPVSRTLRVEVDLDNADGRLQPGMYVNVRVNLAERKDVPTLPAASIFRDGSQSYCWCVEDGKAVRKPITPGIRVDEDVEIVSGLSEDEAVVRSSPAPLKQGQAVTVGAP